MLEIKENVKDVQEFNGTVSILLSFEVQIEKDRTED